MRQWEETKRGSLPTQVRWEAFQEQQKRLQQSARWCYRLSWMLVRLGMFSCYTCASTEPLRALLRSYQMALLQSLSLAWKCMTELGLNPATAVRIQVACTDELDQIWKKMYFQAATSTASQLRNWTNCGLSWEAPGLTGVLGKSYTASTRKTVDIWILQQLLVHSKNWDPSNKQLRFGSKKAGLGTRSLVGQSGRTCS